MKYYSEILHKTYDTEKECIKAEKMYEDEIEAKKAAEEQKKNQRAEDAKKVEIAYENLNKVKSECAEKVKEAQKVFNCQLDDFLKKYKTYHWSTSSTKDIPHLFDFFNLF